VATQIKLPSLGENIDSAGVLSILVGEGDVVAKDQDLIEVETDKATMPIPSPQAGKIVKVLVSEGDNVPVGGPIFEIEATNGAAEAKAPKSDKPAKAEKPAAKAPAEQPEEDDDEAVAEQQEEPAEDEPAKPAPAKAKKASAKSPPPPPESVPVLVDGDEDGGDGEEADVAPAPKKPAAKSAAKKAPAKAAPAEDAPGDGRAVSAAGPAVRRLARELGVELRRVRPSGDGGRITDDDVRNYVRLSQAAAEASSIKGVTPPGSPDADNYGGVRREKMTRMRQAIARNMVASYTTIPQLTNFDDVDLTELEALRQDSTKDYSAKGIKLTTMPFLVKACAVALKHHPIVNASVDDEGTEIIYKEYVNIGIAVDTERGLIVPVLRDADRKNIPQIAAELAKIAETARAGKTALEDLRGGTFSISNLGAVGGTYSTPIINPPEAAILLAGRSRILPQWIDDQWEPRLMLPLSLTYDHRIVDGAAAARFLNDVKGYLANPGRLLLAP
jgi:pyruvate dehydrogenase E2 component (dihydrolipoamide acetyltransferase)